jgi:hypothetical protein
MPIKSNSLIRLFDSVGNLYLDNPAWNRHHALDFVLTIHDCLYRGIGPFCTVFECLVLLVAGLLNEVGQRYGASKVGLWAELLIYIVHDRVCVLVCVCVC